ncbi:low molecular weight protein-tyrosine-phosphatase [Flindersiella endophytica]
MSDLPPKDPSAPYRICVVCLGNICRSPIAEVVLTDRLRKAGLDHAVVVDSAGTGGWHVGEDMDPRSRRTLEQAGYDVPPHQARVMRADWFDERELILGMDRRNLNTLSQMSANAPGRVRMFGSFGQVGEVPDPYEGGPEGFVRVLAMVEQASDVLVAELTTTLR